MLVLAGVVASTWSVSFGRDVPMVRQVVGHRKGRKADSSAPVQFGSANLHFVQSQLQRFLCPG